MQRSCLLVENSRDITGAFESAFCISETLRGLFTVNWVLPSNASVYLSNRLQDAGFSYWKLPLLELGFGFGRIMLYIPRLIMNAIHLRFLANKLKPEIIIINDYYNLVGVILRILLWRGCLITYVRIMPSNTPKLLSYVWAYLAIIFSTHVIAVSKAVKEQLPRSKKIKIIYDPFVLKQKKSSVYKVNERTNCSVRFLYLANYISGKGHMDGLLAFSAISARFPRISIRFVGSDMGLEKNRKLKLSLIDQVIKLGLVDKVRVMGFAKDVECVIEFSDVLLNFSKSESFSRTCLEAGLYGKPIIATRCGGPEEIVVDGVSGVLVPIGDIHSMTNAMRSLAENASLRESMGFEAFRIVRERFSEERFLANFLPLVSL